ncbi:MAG: terminase family protein, partial [Sedimenticola sp.]
MDIDNLPSEKLRDLEESLKELQRRKLADPIGHYKPYPKQREFHNLGASKRERALVAANQIGKSYSASMETAIHLIGHYPEWWKGKRFNKPVRGWVLGQTSEAVRDTVQRLLLGPLNAPGTGAIPNDAIQNRTLARGVSDAVDTIIVKHKSGGYSQLSFRSYGRGREKLQGESLDFIHVDEEPQGNIYTELLARISARKGILYATFTPLLGMSEVVQRFLSSSSDDRAYVQAGIADALHISPEERQKIIEGYP